MEPNTLSQACVCGSGLNYADCCQPFHLNTAIAPTAQALMRSRYSAYVLRNSEYLFNTWDSSKRPALIDFSKETAEWQSLSILACKKGSTADTKGIVEFKAFYQQDNDDCFLHEISRFVKKGPQWLYLDGVIKAAGKVAATQNTGKNAPCACGSGKKFKRCCGA